MGENSSGDAFVQLAENALSTVATWHSAEGRLPSQANRFSAMPPVVFDIPSLFIEGTRHLGTNHALAVNSTRPS